MKQARRFMKYAKGELEEYKRKTRLGTKDVDDIIDIRTKLFRYEDLARFSGRTLLCMRIKILGMKYRRMERHATF